MVRMASTKKSTNNECWGGCWEKGNCYTVSGNVKLAQPLRRPIWRFRKKIKIELSHDPAIPLLGTHPEKMIIQEDTCTPVFIAALFTVVRTWKQPKCPSTEKWIKKMWYICTMEYSVQFSCSVVSDSFRPHELQHTRPPCPSPTPGVHSDSRPLSQWCHPAISSSVVPFSCPQSLPASESFPMS